MRYQAKELDTTLFHEHPKVSSYILDPTFPKGKDYSNWFQLSGGKGPHKLFSLFGGKGPHKLLSRKERPHTIFSVGKDHLFRFCI